MTISAPQDPNARLNRSTTVLLMFLAALGSVTIDLYLPALPALQRGLGAATAAAQLTLTATTVGFAVGQLVAGTWSDSVGRRTPLVLSTAMHVVASLGVAMAPGIAWVLVFRLLQGAGAAGSAVAATAIVRDVLSGRPFVRMLAQLAIVSGLAPVVAPLLGSQLLLVMSWRGLFLVIAGYGVAMFVLTLVLLRETLPPERRLPVHPRAVLLRYRDLACDRAFVGVALVGGMIVSGVFAMMTSSSFLLQTTLGLDAQTYALLLVVNAVAFVLGTQTGARVLRRWAADRLLIRSLSLTAVAGLATMATGRLGVAGVTCTTAVFMLGAGLSVPCLQVTGLGAQGHRAGTAAAALGATNYALAGAMSPVVGLLGVGSPVPMGLVMGLTQAVALLVLVRLVRPGVRRLDSRGGVEGGPGIHPSPAATRRPADPQREPDPQGVLRGH